MTSEISNRIYRSINCRLDSTWLEIVNGVKRQLLWLLRQSGSFFGLSRLRNRNFLRFRFATVKLKLMSQTDRKSSVRTRYLLQNLGSRNSHFPENKLDRFEAMRVVKSMVTNGPALRLKAAHCGTVGFGITCLEFASDIMRHYKVKSRPWHPTPHQLPYPIVSGIPD